MHIGQMVDLIREMNYGNCTKSSLGLCEKLWVFYILWIDLWRKKMGVEQKVDLTLLRQIMGILWKVDWVCAKNHGYFIYSELICGEKR